MTGQWLAAAGKDGWWRRISGDIIFLRRVVAAIVVELFGLCLQLLLIIENMLKFDMIHCIGMSLVILFSLT